MHIAQRKELDVHKSKRKRGRNRTTTSLVLDSSMQRGRWEFRLNQRIWLRLSSVFESRRISFLKIFLVSHGMVQLLSNIEGLGLKFFLCHMNSLGRDQVWELIEVERIKMQFCQISWH